MSRLRKRYITLEQLREKLGGRSRSSIYRDLENGHVPNPVRVGTRLYWIEEEVDMPLAETAGSVVLNHADNFFAFSVSPDTAQDVAKALSSGIAGLSGGDFHGKTEQAFCILQGFKMLGCRVYPSKSGDLEASPTEANEIEFAARARKQKQRVYGRLTAALEENSKLLRIEGLQEFLRFESMVQGWVQAFAFCGPMVGTVKDHYDYDLDGLRTVFQIDEKELNPLKDVSTKITVKWYSGA